VLHHAPPSISDLLEERVSFIREATVIDAVTVGSRTQLLVEQHGLPMTMESATVILATGARELFLPFPGWTLPGVVGVGGLQALMKSGLDVRGRRIVVAGTGPLLLPVAATAVQKGAEVVAVIEQHSLSSMARFSMHLASRPFIAFSALKYVQQLEGGVLQYGKWVSRASGAGALESVTITSAEHQARIECDYLATAYGLVPNTEIARRLGCDVRGGSIVVDDMQRTSVAGVYAAGECTGVAGVEKAKQEGEVAGNAAVGQMPQRLHKIMLRRSRSWGVLLDRAFAPRPEVLALATPDTIICRCEDVRLRDIDSASSSRQAKLYARAGMGACQGRVCGAALQHMFGWSNDSIRAPLQPAALSSFLGAG
jgi:NADPH-dependent 2,4-dienoyl-CoA reductase/sulfur reductase-like enzyme